MMPTLRRLSPILLWLLCSCSDCCLGQSLRSDAAARTVIFGSESLENTLAFVERLAGLPESTQYQRLLNQVFPPETDFIHIQFASAPRSWPSRESGFLSTRFPAFQPHSNTVEKSTSQPAALLVPAVSLIEIAARSGRLSEVESLLNHRATGASNSEIDVRVLRSLIALAQNRTDEASEHLFAIADLLKTREQVRVSIGSVLALIWKACPRDSLREPCTSLTLRCYELARVGGSPLEEVWKRHSFATHYRLRSLTVSDHAISFDHHGRSKHGGWRPVSRSTPQSAGEGYAAATWRLADAQASKVASSDRDFLYFDIPLTGDFAVEAIVSGFSYHETQLGYGGTWCGPAYDHKTLLRGHYSRDQSSLKLSPPLDEIKDSMRVRLEVHQGVVRTSINGREVHQAPVSASDPWLTISSGWYTHGWVKNLRILGDPQIPASIDLLADQRMLGWDAFYGSMDGENADWELATPADQDSVKQASGLVLRGKRRDLIAGSQCERLLRYHRPIFDDAVLSYEFYYRAGSHAVHPAISDHAYILNADGQVVVHRMTDGIYERMDRRPEPASGVSRSPSDALLHNEDWNRVDVRIADDKLRLSLNGKQVYEAIIAPHSAPVFGLFHYCDQTEALVRDLHWKGDWSEKSELIRTQELTDDRLDQILRGAEFSKTYHHDFAQGFPLEDFAISGENWKQNLKQQEDGIRLTRPGGNFVQYAIVPNLQLGGDFDVIAEFRDFGAKIDSGGDANIQLMLGFSQHAAEYRLYRKFSRFEKKESGQQIIQAAYFHTREGHRNYEFPKMTSEAAAGGKLRFIRRGDQLHFLFAANDSDYYRLLHSEVVPTDPTRANGIALGIETTKAGEATVIWKSLQVRAQQMTGSALEDTLSLEQLNESRDKLPHAIDFDFSKREVAQQIQTWGTDSTFQYQQNGLLITAPGFKDWHGHGVSPRISLQGDFDVQLELEVQHLEPPQPGGECVVYLETRFQDRLQTSIQTKFAMSPSGVKTGELTHLYSSESGESHYKELMHYPLDTVHALRLARRAKTVYVLIQETPASTPVVLGRIALEDATIPLGTVNAVLHTAGLGRKTIALFKRLSIRSAAVLP
ncbi:MAG: DUF1583 domain-containing protein [Planctomycetaceae bacterium]